MSNQYSRFYALKYNENTEIHMTGSLQLKARAKINLALDVTNKRPDGYHNIRTIMQTIELYDIVTVNIIEKGIEVECNVENVPLGRENTAYRAAELFIGKYGIDKGVKISIKKNIPVAAGLAGGSSDAAAVLKAMNQLFGIEADENELINMGRNIGADVPYCIKGGTILAEGIGDILTELKPLPKTYLLLVKPDLEVSTKVVYQSLDINKINKRPDMSLLKKAIEEGRIEILAGNMVNVLETVTASKYEEINIIKDKLISLGAIGSVMSGSGPTVFGIFRDRQAAEEACRAFSLSERNMSVIVTETA